MNKKTLITYIATGLLMLGFILLSLCTSGCSSLKKNAVESAGQKNLDLRGYLMLGELSTDTNGRLIIGRLDYRSRKVSIPAETKTPNTGFFKSTKTKSLFGTEETIVEYDWTAGSDADAEKARQICEELRKKAEEEKTEEKAEEATKDEVGSVQDK